MTPTPSRPPRILVFDSGVGGLSVLRAIARQTPGCELILLSDNAAFPYGTKPEPILIERVLQVMDTALPLLEPDLLVVACNTASTLALPSLRRRFSLPVVGVVPAIKPAAALSQTRVIGLLATPATVVRAYTHQLITDYAADCEVIPVGSSELVWLAEQKLRGEILDDAAIRSALSPLFDHPRATEMDTLVLACTHFPLLNDEIAAHLPENVSLIDSGDAIARRVESLLGNIESTNNAVASAHRALFTRKTVEQEQLRTALAGFGLTQLDILDIPAR